MEAPPSFHMAMSKQCASTVMTSPDVDHLILIASEKISLAALDGIGFMAEFTSFSESAVRVKTNASSLMPKPDLMTFISS